jgi:feruloyl esterase
MKHLSLTAAALSLIGGAAAAQDAASCEALANTAVAGGFVTSANMRDATEALPAYCEVRATALPAINIEVRLPMENWNGHFYQAGCGGFCGILGRADASGGWVNAMRPGLEKGYATATSDSGHHGLSVVDAAWAEGDTHAERDWGWRSIGETNRVAQVMIEEFYGAGSDRAIFQGCSTGGRMAHVASLRYPEMFDGIISGAPAMDYPGLVSTKMSYLMQANTAADGSQILTVDKVGLIGDHVMASCDAVDGAEDGLIADPGACDVDYAALQCEGGATQGCLTEAELGVVAAWRQGPQNSAGDQLYPGGIPEGSEPFWWLWLTGNGEGGGKLVNAFTTNFTAYMAFPEDPGAGWRPTDFDLDTDPARLAGAAAMYNGDDPDISAFRDAGGKMIVWHGWGDAIVTPYKTLDWHAQAAELAGGAEALAENVALFMEPGMDHCGILPGPGGTAADLDPLTPLEAWLDGGPAPTTIRAAQ